MNTLGKWQVDKDGNLFCEVFNKPSARYKLMLKKIYRWFRYFPHYKSWDVTKVPKEFRIE